MENNNTNQQDLGKMILLVHEHIEGRYDLDSYDLGIVHSLLCEYDILKGNIEDNETCPFSDMIKNSANGKQD